MKKAFALFMVLMALSMPLTAVAQEEMGEEKLYTFLNQDNVVITTYFGAPEVGDEYISGQNEYYRVRVVDDARKVVFLESLGAYEMPDVSWLSDVAPVAAMVSSQSRAVAIYCTHSDESYEPSDGKSSDEQRGGIFDVARSLADAFEEKGITAYQSDNTHHPHDAGAYRRSRATAAELLKKGVDAIFDIHRDGIPDPAAYETRVGGESMTMVRLEVGRANQNAQANKAFATRIKAIADSVYPGLIKDIYIGKGSYNQDLAPHAVLLEFGTHTTSKEDAQASAAYMGDVLVRAIYGGVTGAAGASDVGYQNANTGEAAQADENAGAWTGILWVLGILVVGSIIYALAATGRLKPAMEKTGSTFREMTGGLFGRKKDKEH